MTEMTSAERIMRVLKRQEPDRVPHFEWIIDRKVREAIIPGCSMEEFTVRMGLDAILTGPDFKKERIGPGRYRNEYGVVLEDSAEEHGVPVEGPIKTMDDLRGYTPPDPHAPGRYASIERVVKAYKGALAVGVHLNDVFSIPRAMAGFETLMMAIALEPDLVRGLVDLSVDINLDMAKEVAARGVDFVFTGDDFASAEGPFMSPDSFRELFYPGYKRAMEGFHALGLPIIKHSDGNLMPIIDMVLDAPIDCLDPIDPMAGMDMGEMKAAYGDRVALKGNVDCAHLLTFGSVGEVVEATKDVLAKGAPGGGLILSSSNSIHSAVKPGNYLAMWNAVRMYGRYPLALGDWEGCGTGDVFG